MNDIQKLYEDRGQGHVFQFINSLDEEARAELLDQAAAIDLDEIAELTQSLIRGSDAHEESLGREVALKVLRASYGDTGDLRARFEREVRAAARLRVALRARLHAVSSARRTGERR